MSEIFQSLPEPLDGGEPDEWEQDRVPQDVAIQCCLCRAVNAIEVVAVGVTQSVRGIDEYSESGVRVAGAQSLSIGDSIWVIHGRRALADLCVERVVRVPVALN